MSEDVAKSLDFSDGSAAASSANLDSLIDEASLGQTMNGTYDAKEMDYESSDEEDTSSTSKLSSFFKGLTGQKVLKESDLEQVIQKMKEHLVNKNVASEIASILCDAVQKSLIGKKTSSFTSLYQQVKNELEVSLKRILTPKTSTDLLHDIHVTNQTHKRPYSIVFVGVNGVMTIRFPS